MSFNPYQPQIDELRRRIAENQALLTDPELKELAEAEVQDLQAQLAQLEAASAEYDSGSDDGADSSSPSFTNCIIEIRPGTGGDEAKIWANDLLRMYLRFMERIGLKVEHLDDLVIKVKGKVHDPELVSELIENSEAVGGVLVPYEIFKYESGVHRVQRVPETEAAGRIHTSTASVAVIPEVKKTAVQINDGDLQWEFMRAGGAGGQNVNKVNSAVRLTHVPSGIAVSSRQERSQAQNREIALELLRGQLWELQEEKRLAALGKARSAIGRSMRAEKIRTFNYPQNRVTDHRINQSWYSLETIIEGDLAAVIKAVRTELETDSTLESSAEPTTPTSSPPEEM